MFSDWVTLGGRISYMTLQIQSQNEEWSIPMATGILTQRQSLAPPTQSPKCF